MLPYSHRFLRAVLAAPILFGVASPVVQAGDFVTAEGRTVILPEIHDMTCDEMDVTLTQIDLTRYRENAPTPHHADDKPLYYYEKELACVHFHSCVMGNRKAGGGNDLRKCPERK